MKKIIYIAKIGLGIILVLAAAYSLSSFEGFVHMILGATLMLAGVMLGVLLEKRSRRLLLALSLFSVLIILLLNISLLQYLFGGILIYFACSLAFDRKKPVIS